MQPEENHRRREAKDELCNLAISDHPLPSGSHPKAAEEVVGVHESVNRRIGDECDGQEGLRRVQPEVGHGDDNCVVVHVEEGEALPGWVDDN